MEEYGNKNSKGRKIIVVETPTIRSLIVTRIQVVNLAGGLLVIVVLIPLYRGGGGLMNPLLIVLKFLAGKTQRIIFQNFSPQY